MTENTLNGVGNNLRTGFYTNRSEIINLNTPFLEEPGYKYYDLSINTFYQNITQTNLTFSGLKAENTTYVVEDYPENFFTNAEAPGLQVWGAMSFKISTPCILKRVWAFVQEVLYTDLWNITIYNATRELSEDLMVIPDCPTGISILQRATDQGLLAAHWQNFTFPDVQLNMTNTYVDANGFAYYFFVLLFPIFIPVSLNFSFLYYSNDDVFIDDGYLYGGFVGGTAEYNDADACIKLDLAPLSATPSPSDVGLTVKNPNRPSPTNLVIETNHSLPLAAAYQDTEIHVITQNFTLTEYATIHNFSVYLKAYENASISKFGILPNNETGLGPYWNANLIYDLNVTLNLQDGYEGWFNFTMLDMPNLAPGQYWWALFSDTAGNITLFGTQNPSNSNILALNISGSEVGEEVVIETDIIPNSVFATIIYYQPGTDYFNVSRDWIYNSYLTSDIFGGYHFQIVTRWQGDTSFNTEYTVELENNGLVTPRFQANFQETLVLWNLSLIANFPATNLGKIINITIPLDWNLINVTIGGMDHGAANWTVILLGNQQQLLIYNASNGFWTIWCNSPRYSVNYTIEKFVQGQYQSAVNATIYDNLRVNITIANQSNGICYLTIFYPNGETTFKNQTIIASENNFFYWFPEYDIKATGGNYTFIVNWFNGTELGFNRQYFTCVPIPSNLTLISTIPTPFVNDTTQIVTIRFNDSRGVNIAGATISANLSINSLEWDDIFSKTLDPADRGLYRIKINTSRLNANQLYTLEVSAVKDGYEKVTIPPTQILVAPVSTSLVIAVQNITQFAGEIISFSCSYKDTFHHIDIDWASVSYHIIGTNINGTLNRIMQDESVYEADDVVLINLSGRATPYKINITATADNCESNSKLIDLFVLNKTRTILTILGTKTTFIQGQNLLVRALLENATSHIGISNATIQFTFGGKIPNVIALTDQNGIAEIEISIPSEPFQIQAKFEESVSIDGANTLALSIEVITYANIVMWIGIIVGICLAAIFAVRQFYLVPKRNRKTQEFQKIANKFQDVANLLHLLILHKESAGCIYQQSLGGNIDGDLISGFLHAISSFQTELKPEKVPQKELKVGGFELNYQDYKIFLFNGEFINVALIFDKAPSDQFRAIAQSFVKDYEAQYREFLINWRGDVTPFRTSYTIIAEKLEISLLWPHQIQRYSPTEKFTSLEDSMIQIADTIMKSQATEYFFLPLLLSMATAGRPQMRLEVIATIYNLRRRRTFIPINPELT
ncbi:MAG TPA: hypothetical protein VMV49_12035 [Candidatus Deferrimicrobium sp.]|nr:hypothetical protein [Candidatus Deferrimicrobium sp.]